MLLMPTARTMNRCARGLEWWSGSAAFCTGNAATAFGGFPPYMTLSAKGTSKTTTDSKGLAEVT